MIAREGGETRSLVARLIAAFAVALSTGAGLVLALNYPIGAPFLAVSMFVLIATFAYVWPGAWLMALPAAIPLIGFAPWSGWITFEELDMVVFAVSAGGYLRLLRSCVHRGRDRQPVNALVWLFAAMFVLSIGVSFFRGVADAGGFRFGWFEGYLEPMNSLRLGKSFFLVLLLLPLWREAYRNSPQASAARWSTGLCIGLAGASLAALWERVAFTDLLNFSTDYRTTALFWEMSVGGAALDGFLALTFPFAIRELQFAQKSWRTAAAVFVLMIASYACLTTFSRGVFLAIPVGVAAMVWLGSRQDRATSSGAAVLTSSLPAAACFAITYLAAAFWIFPGSGYRGMLALLGAFALLLHLGAGERWLAKGHWRAVAALGSVLSALVVLLTWGFDKGAYVGYLLAFVVAAAAAALPRTRWVSLAGFVAVVCAIGSVALHWGGEPALMRAVPVMVALLLTAAASATRTRSAWPDALRWQGAVVGSLIALSGIVGVLAGGAYMTGRMATSEQDLQGRIKHWREGIGVLSTPAQWVFGMGLGRYPANYYLLHSGTDAPGDYALVGAPGEEHLMLVGGKLPIGWGELLRVSQRVAPPQQPVVVRLRVRSAQAAGLHLEVCEKHLLYNAGCLLKEIGVQPTAGAWRTVQTPLDGPGVSRGAWFAPKLLSFSIGNGSAGTKFEVDDLQLISGDGTELLVNGDFSHGMSHWFFSSDRNHLPWHLKNIFVHTLFDQGVFGLAVLLSMLAGALWRLGFGAARHHPLAPATASAIIGFVIVGLFDSLMDVPRDAFIFYFLLLQGFTLRSPRIA